jgi:peptidoglycan/LPS O-acetylase OafA/YrhL
MTAGVMPHHREDSSVTADDGLLAGKALTGPPRFKLLDGLRGVAAVAVLLYHFGDRADLKYLFPRGYLAVDFFFVLSGFVLGHAYWAPLRTHLPARMFAARRLVRLFPMLIAGTLLGGMIELGRTGAGPVLGRLPEIALAVVAGCLALPMPFATSMEHTIFPLDGPIWSIFFELIANVVLVLGCKTLKPRRLFWAVLVTSGLQLILISMTIETVNLGFLVTDWFYGLPRALLSFAAGVLLFASPLTFPRLPAYVFPCALLAIFMVPALPFRASTELDLAIISVVFPVLVGTAAASEPARMRWMASGLPGELSFPVYAIHYPIVRVVTSMLKHRTLSVGGRLGVAAMSMVCVCALAGTLWQFYDKPIRRRLNLRLRGVSRRRITKA